MSKNIMIALSIMVIFIGFVSFGKAGLSTNANWTVVGQADSNYLGRCVADAGDVNGDGYSDVIVGASNYDSNRGKAYVFLGGASGLQTTTNWTCEGEGADDWLGSSVAGVGDVNGDGYDDVLVGAFLYGAGNTGRAYLFLGSADGLQSTTNRVLTGEVNGDYFGRSVAGAGDVNGDGYADVIIGAPLYNGAGSQRGKTYVFLGCTSGLQATTNWTSVGETDTDDFGWSVAGAGDVNGDGYADVIVGAYMQDGGGSSRGKAYVFLGGDSGVQATTNWTVVGENDGDTLGRCVASAGDVNGDGFSDVIAGANQFDGGGASKGKTYVFLGSAAGVQTTTNWTMVGENDNDNLGLSVAGAGDVNGDSYSDVAVGAYLFNGGGTNRGKAYLFLGGANGVQSTTNWAVVGEADTNQFGYSVSDAGDVNGDGFADVIIGADSYHGAGVKRGKAYAFYGGAESLSATANFTASGEADDNKFGYRAADAGDVNGDGYSDVIVGAYQYNDYQGKAYLFLGNATGIQASASWTYTGQATNNLLGFAVDGAGDVNGDGYADVIVGAKWYTSGGLTRRGKAYLFLGSSDGLEVSPIWTAIGEDSTDVFGNSVAGAGDVNGDGYSDVLIGAESYDNKGKAYLFLGNSSGLQTTTNWTCQGDNSGDWFGSAVSGAGDVNGDGYADVIIGAEGYNSYQGAAYVFLGSASGLGTQTNWTTVGENDDDRFGRIVASGGDVNSDGFADILVNAYAYPSNQGSGKAYLFLGSASGPQTTTNWTAVGENSGNYFATGLAGAGDVNGDGYGDVIAGAYGYDSSKGKAYVFLGSASGLQAQTNWTVTGESVIDDFGQSASGAGDVNGDGFADVVISAPRQEGGGSYRGKVYVYYGNSSPGRLVRVRQTQVSGQPIQPWGLSTNSSSVSVRMNATRPDGRRRVKLEVQAAPAGTVFGGAGTITNITSSWKDTTATNHGVVVTNIVTGLTPGALYHWRARVLYAGMGATNSAITNSVFPLHGPWRRLHAGAGTYDVRTMEPRISILGTNGAVVASGETPSAAKGTDFGAFTSGDSAVSNTFAVTNGGNQVLSITGVSTSGSGSAYFHLLNLPSSLAAGVASNVLITFAPSAVGVQTAVFAIVNNSTGSTYVVNVKGTVDKLNQTITFPAIAGQAVTSTVGLSATASSGLPVSFTNSAGSPVSWQNATTITFTATGAVSIVASQAGDANWNVAPNVTNSFNVLPANQTIVTFTPTNGSSFLVTDTVGLAATASSGLPVSFTNSAGSPVSWQNATTITFTATGMVNIVASQAGNATYNAAPNVTNRFTITGPQSLSAPQNVAASDGRYADKVALVWSAASGATGYQVWRHTANDSSAAAQIGSPSQTNYNDTAAIVGCRYYYWVKATNTSGISAFSSSASGWRGSISAGVSADYDGDGLADPAVYDEATGTWKVKLSSAGYYLIITALNGLGGPGYASVSADYDGDAKADPAVYHELTGRWIILPSTANYSVPVILSRSLGGAGYSGMPADYDGDHLADPGVYERNQGDWQVLLSSANYYEIDKPGLLGGMGYRAVAADYDGDGLADPAIYGESNGMWAFKISSANYLTIILTQTLGGAGYIPVPADYDGDGYADPAVRSENSNEWLVMLSSANYTIVPVTLLFE